MLGILEDWQEGYAGCHGGYRGYIPPPPLYIGVYTPAIRNVSILTQKGAAFGGAPQGRPRGLLVFKIDRFLMAGVNTPYK